MKRFYWVSKPASGKGCYLLTWKAAEEGMPASENDEIICMKMVSVEGNEENVTVLLQFAAEELRNENSELFIQEIPPEDEMARMMMNDGGEMR